MSPSQKESLQPPGIRVDREDESYPDIQSFTSSSQRLRPLSASTLSPNPDRISIEHSLNSEDRNPLSAASRPSSSLWDAATLRDRSASFASSQMTFLRSRGNSSATSENTKRYVTFDNAALEEALQPDPRYAQDFVVKDNKFAFTPGLLNKMLNPKSLAAFVALGGVDGLARGLRTDLHAGLSLDETDLSGCITFEDVKKSYSDQKLNPADVSGTGAALYADRTRTFGRNRLPDRKTNSFIKLFWEAYKDKIIILLTIAAVISLALGLYEALSGESKVDWVEGVAIFVAIFLVTIATAANDWQKEKQFARLNKRVRHIFH